MKKKYKRNTFCGNHCCCCCTILVIHFGFGLLLFLLLLIFFWFYVLSFHVTIAIKYIHKCLYFCTVSEKSVCSSKIAANCVCEIQIKISLPIQFTGWWCWVLVVRIGFATYRIFFTVYKTPSNFAQTQFSVFQFGTNSIFQLWPTQSVVMAGVEFFSQAFYLEFFAPIFRSRCRCVVEMKFNQQCVMHRSGIDLTLFLLV